MTFSTNSLLSHTYTVNRGRETVNFFSHYQCRRQSIQRRGPNSISVIISNKILLISARGSGGALTAPPKAFLDLHSLKSFKNS